MKFSALALIKLALAVAPLWNFCGAAVLSTQSDQLSMVAAHDNCTPEQNVIIDKAFSQFLLLARGTEKEYAARLTMTIRKEPADIFRKWFGDTKQATPHNQGAVNQIILQLGEIVRGTEKPFFNCIRPGESASCTADTNGYTRPGGNIVNLCPHFFEHPNLGFNTLETDPKLALAAGILAHEFTHSRLLMSPPSTVQRTMDTSPSDQILPAGQVFRPSEVYTPGGAGETYGYDACLKLAATPDRAITNADNYKWYLQDAYKDYCSSSSILDIEPHTPAAAEKQAICEPLWCGEGSSGSGAKKGTGCTIL